VRGMPPRDSGSGANVSTTPNKEQKMDGLTFRQRKAVLIIKARRRFGRISRLRADREFMMIDNTLMFWYNCKSDSSHIETEGGFLNGNFKITERNVRFV
jgi:hypothetical protein